MIENEGSPRYMSRKDWLDERYGMSMIFPYNPARGAVSYLCKYLLKGQGRAVEGFDHVHFHDQRTFGWRP
jgi:hypothetical protein